MTELEKAAIQFGKSYPEDDCVREDVIYGFEAGAEWQAKQSPWISVEERLPDTDGLKVWVKGGFFDKYPLTYSKGKFYSSLVRECYDGSVTHWMEIPE